MNALADAANEFFADAGLEIINIEEGDDEGNQQVVARNAAVVVRFGYDARDQILQMTYYEPDQFDRIQHSKSPLEFLQLQDSGDSVDWLLVHRGKPEIVNLSIPRPLDGSKLAHVRTYLQAVVSLCPDIFTGEAFGKGKGHEPPSPGIRWWTRDAE